MAVKYLDNEPLQKYTTFKVGGLADRVFLPGSKADIKEIIDNINDRLSKTTVIGGGSNVLISSKGIRGNVILTKHLNMLTLEDNETILAGAGTKLPELAQFCLNNSLTGLEFMAGIPGTVGGAVKMNCSANGQVVSDTLIDIEVLDIADGTFKTINSTDLNLGYRQSSINPKEQIIISARFKLKNTDKESIKALMEKNLNFRKSKQPKGFNSGSAFKNPNNVSSGQLLDQSGAKALQEGDAVVSQLHANFITNINSATSIDISRLMLRMRNAVLDKTGYKIYPEIQYIGEPTKEEEKIWKILKDQ